ncbi:hypothetical protein HMPREF0201_01835 [Cedecea davisae DSM 4568]|uniref:Uncharacterized protein n=1 Tax=Cedecea davisae DSM 4568 TaxID=566551 RepID=S3IZC5_9ENTR|nr:hypothetical protein HMPREF0201_01835 [Cedecea davisae DSM 4568]
MALVQAETDRVQAEQEPAVEAQGAEPVVEQVAAALAEAPEEEVLAAVEQAVAVQPLPTAPEIT